MALETTAARERCNGAARVAGGALVSSPESAYCSDGVDEWQQTVIIRGVNFFRGRWTGSSNLVA